MKVTIIDITPEIAEGFLKLNTFNRFLRKSKVKEYALEMKNGRWKSNGDTIVIGSDNVLKNGQHRLNAVVESGFTIKNQIVVYLPAENANCYDLNAARRASDVAMLNGETEPMFKDNTVYASLFVSGAISKVSTHGYSKTEAVEKIKQHKDACEFIRKYTTKANRGLKKLSKSAVWGAVINAYLSGYPINRLERFCEVFICGIPMCDEEVSIIKLRDYVMNFSQKGGSDITDVYFRTQNALHNFEVGNIVSKCMSTKTEYYKYPKQED